MFPLIIFPSKAKREPTPLPNMAFLGGKNRREESSLMSSLHHSPFTFLLKPFSMAKLLSIYNQCDTKISGSQAIPLEISFPTFNRHFRCSNSSQPLSLQIPFWGKNQRLRKRVCAWFSFGFLFLMFDWLLKNEKLP